MNHLDLVAFEHALTLANRGDTCWLCTRLDTPAPAFPHLSVTREADGPGYAGRPISLTQARGGGACLVNLDNNANDGIPCLVERLSPSSETLVHLEVIHATLAGQPSLIRRVVLGSTSMNLQRPTPASPLVQIGDDVVEVLIQPALRLVLSGHSRANADLARQGQRLGFEVILCAPDHPDSTAPLPAGVEFQRAPAAPFPARRRWAPTHPGDGCHRRLDPLRKRAARPAVMAIWRWLTSIQAERRTGFTMAGTACTPCPPSDAPSLQPKRQLTAIGGGPTLCAFLGEPDG